MSNLAKSNIFSSYLLYIIKLIVISLIFFNFNKVFSEETSIDTEPFEIWGQSTNLSIPQLENSNLEEKIIEDAALDGESNSLEGIIKSDFSYSIDDTIGLYDESNGGFSSSIWKSSNFEDIDYLITNLPKELSNNELLDLKLISLLTIATPPKGIDQSDTNFLQVKMDHFKSVGNYNSILSISELIDDEEWNQSLLENIINFHLFKDNYKAICNNNIFNKISSEHVSLKIRAFCNAMSNNLPAIDLIISLIIEEETYDSELVYILNSYLNETDIDINKIQNLDLYKLNLINNKGIDFSENISKESEIELQLFYINSKTHSNKKKIALAENLLSRGLVDSSTLANVYEKYLINNKIAVESNSNESVSSLEKRVLLYNQIRQTSNQADLIPLASSYVVNMANADLLINSASLIYDKIKIIAPKQENKDHATSVCLLLLLNNDFEQCQKWLTNLSFVKDAEAIKAKIRFYLSLRENTKNINEEDINFLLKDKELSSNHKNVLAKYSELRYELKLMEYWKSKNKLNKISTQVSNIKLAEYLKSIPVENKGEIILLISLIHGNNPTNMLDQHSLFLILESLNRLDPVYLDKFVFEYFVNNQI
tara:strand:+ start:1608 stop:3398 length:1791 start_codon:yes stop_codon:yes gene_type:complete